MQLLYFFEGLRTPFLDALMSFITKFGEETVFTVIAIIVFWCINKYEGYYLLSVSFIGTAVNQFLKMIFRIPRPWVLDEKFTIVESAREAATGYSFPSGHTQNAVGVFGGLACRNKNRLVRSFCIALCILVPISRMYLGVHTPLDVGVSFAVALVLLLSLSPLVRKAEEKPMLLWILFFAMTAVAAAGLLFTELYPFPADVDPMNLQSARENFCKLFGSMLGMLVAYFLDSRYIHFDTKAGVIGQILKLVIGLLLVLAIKSGLKPVMNAIFGDLMLRHSIRYFLMILFAGAIFPLTFPWFAKIGRKPEKND